MGTGWSRGGDGYISYGVIPCDMNSVIVGILLRQVLYTFHPETDRFVWHKLAMDLCIHITLLGTCHGSGDLKSPIPAR